MRNIVLLGMMGAGKTTVGKYLAEALGFIFFDVDFFIEKEMKMKISEIFETKGEGFFRDLEEGIIRGKCPKERAIISTGGGCVERESNIINLKKIGLTFYLKASSQSIYDRIKNQTHRPLLQTSSPFDRIEEILNRRENLYQKADVTILTDGRSVEDIGKEIIKVYENRC